MYLIFINFYNFSSLYVEYGQLLVMKCYSFAIRLILFVLLPSLQLVITLPLDNKMAHLLSST